MKKWSVTRIAHTTIEVESDVEPLTEDKWGFEEKHYKELEESYRDDGVAQWEVTELEDYYPDGPITQGDKKLLEMNKQKNES